MGGATVPIPGGGVGAMAFPSAAEPNPILKGLRGAGTEQIVNQIQPPQAPASAPAAVPPQTAAAPQSYTGPELFQVPNPAGGQYQPLLYSLQGGVGSQIQAGANGQPYGGGYSFQDLLGGGYSDISQVPLLSSIPAGNISGLTYTSNNFQSGYPASFSYNTQSPIFTNYKPTYNPYTVTTPSQFPSLGGLNPPTALPASAYSPGGGLSSSWVSQNLKPYGT